MYLFTIGIWDSKVCLLHLLISILAIYFRRQTKYVHLLPIITAQLVTRLGFFD